MSTVGYAISIARASLITVVIFASLEVDIDWLRASAPTDWAGSTAFHLPNSTIMSELIIRFSELHSRIDEVIKQVHPTSPFGNRPRIFATFSALWG